MNNKVKFLRGTSGEYAVAEKDNDTIYFTTDDGRLYIGDKEISGSDIIIDDTLSDTSTNPVQNKVVKQAIDNKADKTVATTSADGLMSSSDKTKLDNADDTYALKSKYGDTTINVGRKAGTTVGSRSTAEGQATTASSLCSHAEGDQTTASGSFSHSEGEKTKAIGAYSHAEGCGTEANGIASHAEGRETTAFGDYSHTSGHYTKALHDNEAAYGKYNESNDNTLFSIGDGTADDARHNAFEITTTGGKLHDKDIATTDLIPTELPANGGNADTVDGLHAADFVNANDMEQIQIPSNVDVPNWIYTNGKRYQRYMTNSTNIGTTNIPNDSISWVWYWFDGINIFAREWETGKYYICDTVNGGFSGWKDVYTSGFKPYVTGSVILPINEKTITTNHNFQPSAVFWWNNAQGFEIYSAAEYDTTSFSIEKSAGLYREIGYIIFR